MTTRRVPRIRLVALAAALILTAAVRAGDAAVTRLVIFGDSLSDTGNVYDLIGYPPPPYWQGRFSNGPVWVEEIAEGLGVPAPVASRNGGTNYAYGGATTAAGGFLLLDMGGQVARYLSAGPDPSDGDLFILLGGANDFFDGEGDASVPVNNLVGYMETLAAAGAQRFLVANLPPLGQTPDYRGTPDEAPLDALTLAFNAQYAAALDQLEIDLGLTIARTDLQSLFEGMLGDPAAYGLTNVTDPAYDGASVVPDPERYLFWDGVHATEVGHGFAADAALAALMPAVPGDATGDGVVDFSDLLAVLSTWGTCPAPPEDCPADLDGSGVVGFDDLLIVLSHWDG